MTLLFRINKSVLVILLLIANGLWLNARSTNQGLDNEDNVYSQYKVLRKAYKEVKLDSFVKIRTANSFQEAYKNILLLNHWSNKNYNLYDSLRVAIVCDSHFELSSDPFLQGHYYNAVCKLYQESYMPDLATSMFHDAIKAFLSIGEEGRFSYMNTLSHMSITHQYYGGNLDSAEYYALELQDLIDEYGNDGYGLEYRNTYCLAALYRLKTNLEYALYWAKRAKNLIVTSNQLDSNSLADIEIVIANIEFERINYNKARESYLKGIGIKKDLDLCSKDLLYFYNSYMTYLVKQGELDELEVHIKEFESLPGSESDYWRFIISKFEGYLHMLSKDYDKGIEVMLKGLSYTEGANFNAFDISLLNELIGFSYYFKSDFSAASNFFERAMTLFSDRINGPKRRFELIPREIYLNAYYVYCNMKADSNEINHVQNYLEELDFLKWNAVLSSLLVDPISRLYTNSALAYTYDLLLTHNVFEENHNQIFELINKKKGGIERSMSDVFNCVGTLQVDEILKLDAKIRSIYQKNNTSEFLSQELILYQDELVRRRGDMIHQLRDSTIWENTVRCLMRSDHRPSDKALDSMLIMTIYYNENIFPHDELIVASKLNDTYKSVVFVLPDSVKAFIDNLSENDQRSNLSKNNNDMLYRYLIEPFECEIELSDNITVINDGPFYSFPFGSIRDKVTERPLYLDKSITYSFDYESIGLREDVRIELDTLNVVSFTDEQSILRSTDTDLRELPGAYLESDCAAMIFKEAFVARGLDATWENFKDLSRNSNVFHIATHGEFDNENFLNNRIYFRKSNYIDENDPIYVTELLDLKQATDLLVLTACNSSSGKKFRSFGAISFAREYAAHLNSKSISYLWSLDDMKGSEVLCMFYDELKKDGNPIQSLNLARQAFFEKYGPDYQHVLNGIVFYH